MKGEPWIHPIRVDRDGYQPASRAAFLGWDYDGVDIQLVRN